MEEGVIWKLQEKWGQHISELPEWTVWSPTAGFRPVWGARKTRPEGLRVDLVEKGGKSTGKGWLKWKWKGLLWPWVIYWILRFQKLRIPNQGPVGKGRLQMPKFLPLPEGDMLISLVRSRTLIWPHILMKSLGEMMSIRGHDLHSSPFHPSVQLTRVFSEDHCPSFLPLFSLFILFLVQIKKESTVGSHPCLFLPCGHLIFGAIRDAARTSYTALVWDQIMGKGCFLWSSPTHCVYFPRLGSTLGKGS